MGTPLGVPPSELHFNGLRFDFTEPIKGTGGKAGWDMLREINRQLHFLHPGVYTVAEHFPYDPSITRPALSDGTGCGFDAQWYTAVGSSRATSPWPGTTSAGASPPLRQSSPAFRADAEVVRVYTHNDDSTLAYLRRADGEEYLVVASLHRDSLAGYPLPLPPGRWKEVLNSDSARYGGNDFGDVRQGPFRADFAEVAQMILP